MNEETIKKYNVWNFVGCCVGCFCVWNPTGCCGLSADVRFIWLSIFFCSRCARRYSLSEIRFWARERRSTWCRFSRRHISMTGCLRNGRCFLVRWCLSSARESHGRSINSSRSTSYLRTLLITICVWMFSLPLCPSVWVQISAWYPGKFFLAYSSAL